MSTPAKQPIKKLATPQPRPRGRAASYALDNDQIHAVGEHDAGGGSLQECRSAVLAVFGHADCKEPQDPSVPRSLVVGMSEEVGFAAAPEHDILPTATSGQSGPGASRDATPGIRPLFSPPPKPLQWPTLSVCDDYQGGGKDGAGNQVREESGFSWCDCVVIITCTHVFAVIAAEPVLGRGLLLNWPTCSACAACTARPTTLKDREQPDSTLRRPTPTANEPETSSAAVTPAQAPGLPRLRRVTACKCTVDLADNASWRGA